MFTHKRISTLTILLSAVILISGCQLTTVPSKPSTSYGEYYLTLQQLTPVQLSNEVDKLQGQITQIPTQFPQQDYNTQIKLLLLYSLPKSPIYNSFNAKSLLNKMKKEKNHTALVAINANEKALISLLYDQLNQRLLMRNRLLEQQQRHRDKTSKQQQALANKISLLERTITQLKNIDQTINKREQ